MQTINVSTLKAKVSEVLRKVRNGASFTILDRATPIALLSGMDEGSGLIIASLPENKFAQPSRVSVGRITDPLKLLAEDRARR